MTLLPNCYGSTTFYETIDRLGPPVPLASLHPNAGMGTGGAAHYRTRERALPDRYEREEVSRWDLVHLGQSPWPSPSGARPCDQEAAGQGRTFNAVRTLQSTGDSARASIDSNRTQRPDTCVLFRQWVDSGRSRAQNGGAVLAAATSRDRSQAYLSASEAGLPRRYHRGCQRGQHRAIPFAIQVAAVPYRRSRPALLLSLPAQDDLPVVPDGLP